MGLAWMGGLDREAVHACISEQAVHACNIHQFSTVPKHEVCQQGDGDGVQLRERLTDLLADKLGS